MTVRSLSHVLLATLIVAVCFACVGCGGGGGGGGSSAVTPSYLKVPNLRATVPASGGGSVRTGVRALPAPVASEFSVALFNPETNETLTTITAVNASISGANYVIDFGNDITVAAPSKGVLKMVITRLNVAIMRGYISSAVPSAGETKTMANVDIGSDDLAKALAFEEWQARYVAGTFDNFVNQVMNETTFSDKLNTLIEKVEATLITLVTSQPDTAFTWNGVEEVKSIADDFKDVAEPPANGGVGIPANIQVNGFVASPATQVRCAIESILNLANVGMPSRLNASVAPTSPAVPALTPILGTNQAIDIKSMQNLLMSALQGGTSATEYPLGSLERLNTSEVSYTSTSVEIFRKESYWNGSSIALRKTGRQLLEGVEVTAADGVISQIKFGANSTFTNEAWNPTTASAKNRVVFKITSGVTGVAMYQKVASEGFIIPPYMQNYPIYGGTVYGVAYTHAGYQKQEVTISGPVVAEVTASDLLTGETAGGKLTVSGVTGTITETHPFYYGQYGSKIGGTFTPSPWNNGINEYHFFGEESQTNDELSFSGNTLGVSVTAESTAKDVYLRELSLNLTGITKIPSGEYEGEYKVSGISGKVVAAYNGTSYKDYGYIKQLEITIANASFDPSATQQIPDGATVTLKKTNSDNTTDTLTYTITNGKPVLSGSTNFQGGNATVSTTDGNVKYTGTITFQDPTAKKMVMTYEALQVYDSPVMIATATLTFIPALTPATRVITYSYISTPTHLSSGITDGLYKYGNEIGHFTWKLYDPIHYQIVNKVISTDIPDWQDFLLTR